MRSRPSVFGVDMASLPRMCTGSITQSKGRARRPQEFPKRGRFRGSNADTDVQCCIISDRAEMN